MKNFKLIVKNDGRIYVNKEILKSAGLLGYKDAKILTNYNKKNEIRIVEPNAKNEEDWDWVQNADFTTNEFFRIGVKTLFDVKPGEVVNVTTTKGKVRIHVR